MERLIEANCARCGAKFFYLRAGSGRHRRYCGPECSRHKGKKRGQECAVGGCYRAASTRGMCPKHYRQVRVLGSIQGPTVSRVCHVCGSSFNALYRQGRMASICPRCLPKPKAEPGSPLTCTNCGATFQAPPRGPGRMRRYCSSACRAEAKASRRAGASYQPITAIHCARCGDLFLPTRRTQQYCCYICRLVKPKRAGNCAECGTSFKTRRPQQAYCSPLCQRRADGRKQSRLARAEMRSAYLELQIRRSRELRNLPTGAPVSEDLKSAYRAYLRAKREITRRMR